MVLKLAIVAAIMYAYCQAQFWYALDCTVWYSALIQGFVFGLVTGDMATAMILAGGITLLTISQVASGGVQPSDIAFAGCVAIPIALVNHMDLGTALPLAVATGLIGNFLTPITYNVANIFPHMVDKYAEKADVKGIKRTTWLGAACMAVITGPVAFLSVYFGADVIEAILAATPEWILNGLNVAGGVLPAIGIAVTMKIINQPKLTPIFILGYFLVQLLGLSVVGAAIIGFCIVALMLAGDSLKVQTAGVTVDDDDDEI